MKDGFLVVGEMSTGIKRKFFFILFIDFVDVNSSVLSDKVESESILLILDLFGFVGDGDGDLIQLHITIAMIDVDMVGGSNSKLPSRRMIVHRNALFDHLTDKTIL